MVDRLATIHTNATWNAPADRRWAWPVLLVSPAAGSDPAFYSGIAEELASHGFVVAALGHPYERPNLRLSGGRVARAPEPVAGADAFSATRERILWRAQDLRLALTQLSGGLVNLDGGVLGGPYYDDSASAGPRAPMLWLQAYHPAPADSQLAGWKLTRAQWDSFDIRANKLIARSRGGGWRLVIPDSVHEAFSDVE